MVVTFSRGTETVSAGINPLTGFVRLYIAEIRSCNAANVHFIVLTSRRLLGEDLLRISGAIDVDESFAFYFDQ